MPVVLTAKRIVALTVALVFAYIFWIGPQRFCFESWGTCILSPLIYIRLLPLSYGNWLVTTLFQHPLLGYLLCAAPILLLFLALAAAIQSLRRNSLPFALASLFLTTVVFSVYHLIQPMGISVVYY